MFTKLTEEKSRTYLFFSVMSSSFAVKITSLQRKESIKVNEKFFLIQCQREAELKIQESVNFVLRIK